MDLNICIISKLKSTKLFVLYQQNINLNTKDLKIAAWQQAYIAPGSHFYTKLPSNFEIQGKIEENKIIYKTKLLPVNFDESFEFYMNENAFDIQSSFLETPKNNTIDLYNSTDFKVWSLISKNSRPLFAAKLRPNSKLNFIVLPSLYISLLDLPLNKTFFNVSSLFPITKIDFKNQKNVNIILNENNSNGRIEISYNFD
ncbi:hypothetical protein [Clostridium felsineum]|uniref:hypothetical protein n=1 Tax=Clostridium felsineum TaxID=36839 RepID=UPI00098C89CE|nr:hypothetical protein [Clostridium felsineum]URZ18730.1 hypothetical protein CLFE_048180 [Clostridium felsineum DSM 794]